MSLKSIVKRTLNLSDHKITKIDDSGSTVDIHLKKKLLHKLPCSRCGTRSRRRDSLPPRKWRHVSLWGIRSYVHYTPSRIKCKKCGVVVEDIPWSMGKSPFTLPLIDILSTFAELMPWDQVANMFNVSWGTVNNAVKTVVEYGLEHRDLSKVRIIGIDEISRKKGHVYHTNVYDLEAKTLLWSGDGRKKETLERFFDEMPENFAEKLVGVCCDMWGAYETVVLERAPQAILVFDKFHIIQHLHKAVDEVRKEENKEFKDSDFNPLTGTKYLWLKNPWNLTPKQKQSLSYLQTINLKISKAYLLKELFREFWSYNMKGWAEKYLDKWFWWATHSRIKPMRDFAWLLRRHEEHILSWFELPIDNGAVEAMNNNAKVISHRSRGFRTDKIYTRAMLHGMGGLPRPEIMHKFL